MPSMKPTCVVEAPYSVTHPHEKHKPTQSDITHNLYGRYFTDIGPVEQMVSSPGGEGKGYRPFTPVVKPD
jgi:hypothetical protein